MLGISASKIDIQIEKVYVFVKGEKRTEREAKPLSFHLRPGTGQPTLHSSAIMAPLISGWLSRGVTSTQEVHCLTAVASEKRQGANPNVCSEHRKDKTHLPLRPGFQILERLLSSKGPRGLPLRRSL